MNPKLALGKKSICWRCGEEFILNEYSLRLVKPHCSKCHKPKGNDIPLNDLVSPSSNSIIDNIPLSLADRLSNTINNAQTKTEEEI